MIIITTFHTISLYRFGFKLSIGFSGGEPYIFLHDKQKSQPDDMIFSNSLKDVWRQQTGINKREQKDRPWAYKPRKICPEIFISKGRIFLL